LFVGKVEGVDLRRPVDPATLAEIEAAIDRHAVLIFPGQAIDDEQQIAFSALFGPLEGAAKAQLTGAKPRLARSEIADVSNLDESNRVLAENDRRRLYSLGNRLWHTDASFRRIPARYSMLSARVIPPVGGETEFADLRAAYDALPDTMKTRLEGLVAEHSIWHSRGLIGTFAIDEAERAALPPVPQVLVRTHPGSKRRTLYLAAHAFRIRGLSDADGVALLEELTQFATQPRFVHSHRWTAGDLVMWDNRCTMHRGTDFDDTRWPRDIQRATVADIANSCEQEGLALPA
jgi:alpha-ketoglutarate-dependent 2,4-dichlorophenoxyacetate dioxygenase